MSDDNMRIWDVYCTTNPKYTKSANNGRFSFTSIDPQFQLEQATRLWGPYGHIWGLSDCKFTMLADNMAMMLEAQFHYPINDLPAGPIAEFPIAVDIKYRPGFDNCKVLMTSARSKALSLLGFGADVFMGEYDLPEHIKDMELKYGDQDQALKKGLRQIKETRTPEELIELAKKLKHHEEDGTFNTVMSNIFRKALDEQKGEMISAKMDKAAGKK